MNRPLFRGQANLNLFSAFHSPDGEFLVVSYGSTSYGIVSTILDGKSPYAPKIDEDEYRSIIADALKKVYPQFADGELYHLYAAIRDIRDGKALFYASGDFLFENREVGQERFKGVFFALDLKTKEIETVETQDGLKSWYRGLPDEEASYGSGVFIADNLILTNAHVVGKAERVIVALGNRAAWAKPVSVSERFDLAILSIVENSLDGQPIAFAPSELSLGERVRAFGYPLPTVQGYSLKMTDGTVSGLFGQ